MALALALKPLGIMCTDTECVAACPCWAALLARRRPLGMVWGLALSPWWWSGCTPIMRGLRQLWRNVGSLWGALVMLPVSC